MWGDHLKGVRLANIEDVNAMSFIHAQTWKSAYTEYISYEYLNNITDEGWIPLFCRAFVQKLHEAAVFELDGILTGTVTFGRGRIITTCTIADMSTQDKNSCCQIISLYVLPQYWSTKQGYELTKFALERLKSQGYKSCYLWVIKENERAVNFYKRFGFKSTNEHTTVMLAENAVIEEKYIIYF